MGREQMRNLETFKIGGSQVNEFEYQKHQGEMTEQLDQHPDAIIKGPRRPTQAERVKQIMAEAHRKVEKKRKKEAGKAGGSQKKSAAQPASKSAASSKASKPVAAKAAGKKNVANKSASRKTVNAGGSKTARKK
jgi:hypothetical protein